MQHFLRRNMRDLLAPALHGIEFASAEPFVGRLLQGERSEEVLAHDPVLKLGGLAQHVDQRLAVLDHERRLRGGQSAPCRDNFRQPAAASGWPARRWPAPGWNTCGWHTP